MSGQAQKKPKAKNNKAKTTQEHKKQQPTAKTFERLVKKRRAQICNQIQRFKIPTELRRQTRTSTTHTKHKRSACSRKPN